MHRNEYRFPVIKRECCEKRLRDHGSCCVISVQVVCVRIYFKMLIKCVLAFLCWLCNFSSKLFRTSRKGGLVDNSTQTESTIASRLRNLPDNSLYMRSRDHMIKQPTFMIVNEENKPRSRQCGARSEATDASEQSVRIKLLRPQNMCLLRNLRDKL